MTADSSVPGQDAAARDPVAFDHDVVIVGGGPAGCSAGVFVAREGLDVVVFDRGRSSIKRSAHLENYLGFPAGIDIETLYALMHDHAERAGCEMVPDMVVSVDPLEDADGFEITPEDGEPVTTQRVIAATRYDGEYMRGLDDDAALFETYDNDGDEQETFDRSYAAHDGTTPVDGLYVASPSAEADKQAIMAAGRGARVARRVITDARMDDGWWEDAADDVDWVRREAELDDEWADREAWVEWFDEYYGEDAPVGTDSERFERVREASIDDSLDSYLTPEEIEERAEESHRTLASHLEVEALVDAVDETALLEAMDDSRITEYLDANQQPSTADD